MPQVKKIIYPYIVLLFSFSTICFAQEVKVIDNKGTINNIKNTRVFTGTKPANADAVTGDIYFDVYPNPTTIEIWDADNTEWKSLIIDNTSTTNTVTESTNVTERTPDTFTFPVGYTPVEADVFIYSVASGNHKDVFIYNDGAWTQITPTKTGKAFYLPPIEINIQPLTGTTIVDIYSEYLDQFSTPEVVSSGAPSQIHAYNSDELYYYVTSYDNSAGLISSVTIDDEGVMTINSSVPLVSTSVLFNIVLVVK